MCSELITLARLDFNMAIPPERISVKRRREEAPIETFCEIENTSH